MQTARTALVTGGNRGLGLETSRQLAQRGLRVILTARSESAGAAAVAELAGPGHAIEHRTLDVANESSIAALAQRLERDGEPLDVLINNAGIYHDKGDVAGARRTLDVDFFGPLNLTRALLPRLRDGGNIVMVSSGLGELAPFGPSLRARLLDARLTRDELVALVRTFLDDVERGAQRDAGWPSSPYSVAKAGLNALTRILARELEGRRIRVNSVCPGWVRTDMGGPNAARSVEVGAASIVWAAAPESGPTGGFFRDGRAIEW